MYELAAALLIIGAATPRVVSQIVSSHKYKYKYKFGYNINSLTSISKNTMQYVHAHQQGCWSIKSFSRRFCINRIL